MPESMNPVADYSEAPVYDLPEEAQVHHYRNFAVYFAAVVLLNSVADHSKAPMHDPREEVHVHHYRTFPVYSAIAVPSWALCPNAVAAV
jgi:hypothetical protein